MNFKEHESAAKLRGGYYTDPDIALFLSTWATERSHESVLEPSCGDGVFFEALRLAGARAVGRLLACETDEIEAVKARKRASRLFPAAQVDVINSDFIGWFLHEVNRGPQFDAVVGNPPFIRYQYLEEALQRRFEKLFSLLGVPFTRHTNAWVPFVLASVALLKPGGRLAMVVPAELLHVLHTTGLRRYLLDTCQQVLVLDPVDLWFDGTLQGIVLLLAEKRAQDDQRPTRLGVVGVASRRLLAREPQHFVETADWVSRDEVNGKWMLALLTAKERDLLKRLEQTRGVHRLCQLADVDVGIVTGANKFFLVNDEVVTRFDLQPYAHPMFGRSEHVPGVIYDETVHAANRRAGMPTNFLWFGDAPRNRLPQQARRYIEQGEAEQLHLRYKCRIRNPWYNVPSVYRTPVAMLKRSHDFPRLVWNPLGAFTTDTAYRIRVKPDVPQAALVFAFVTSLTALTAELEGRHYGGGVLELVPSEIERLLVALPSRRRPALLGLDGAFRRKQQPSEILEHQDNEILRKVGLTSLESETLLSAWQRLRNRRHRESGDIEDERQSMVSTKGLPVLAEGA